LDFSLQIITNKNLHTCRFSFAFEKGQLDAIIKLDIESKISTVLVVFTEKHQDLILLYASVLCSKLSVTLRFDFGLQQMFGGVPAYAPSHPLHTHHVELIAAAPPCLPMFFSLFNVKARLCRTLLLPQ